MVQSLHALCVSLEIFSSQKTHVEEWEGLRHAALMPVGSPLPSCWTSAMDLWATRWDMCEACRASQHCCNICLGRQGMRTAKWAGGLQCHQRSPSKRQWAGFEQSWIGWRLKAYSSVTWEEWIAMSLQCLFFPLQILAFFFKFIFPILSASAECLLHKPQGVFQNVVMHTKPPRKDQQLQLPFGAGREQRRGMSSTNIVGPWENQRFPMLDSQMILGQQMVLYLVEKS